MLFDYAGFYDDYQALRFSAIPELPSGLVVYKKGLVDRVRPFRKTLIDDINKIGVHFGGGKLSVWLNGEEVFDDYFQPEVERHFTIRDNGVAVGEMSEQPSVGFAIVPSHVLHFFRPALSPLRDVTFTYWNASGAREDIGIMPLAARQVIIGLIVVFLFAAAWWGDARLFRKIEKSRKLSRAVKTLVQSYPLWPWIAALFVLASVVAVDQAKRGDAEATWLKEYVSVGGFDVEGFKRKPVLRRNGERVEVDLGENVDRVIAFGGSTTHGVPYFRGEYDWPTQLEGLLKTRRRVAGREWQVTNLGFVGNYLKTNFPDEIGAFFEVTKPRAIVINSVINEYYKNRPYDNLWQSLGYWKRQTADRAEGLEEYRAELERAIEISKKYCDVVAVVEPPVDSYYFRGNPWAAWQGAMKDVAKEKGAIVVELQERFDETQQRFVFFEYMHETLQGYRWIAESVFEALEKRSALFLDEADVESGAGFKQ
ncbi:MAG: hypothetical protein P9L99_06145 [Candidatus Lernaella stagnicola]|nr:hypothetical protein [Candidatus Lernaella stagnicola]